MKNRILLGRCWYGLGDWIMLATAIKILNKQYPGIQVDIDVTGIPSFRRDLVNILFEFGCRCAIIVNPVHTEYDTVIPHVVYTNDDVLGTDHLIQGMCNCITRSTGLKLTYTPDLLARYISGPDLLGLPPLQDAVVLSSRGSKNMTSRTKDPGLHWWSELAELLSAKYTVVQLGAKDDPRIPAARIVCLGYPYSYVSSVLSRCRFGVFMENGLAHLAGTVGMRDYVLFLSTTCARPKTVWYPGQTALDYVGKKPTAKEVFDVITVHEANLVTKGNDDGSANVRPSTRQRRLV